MNYIKLLKSEWFNLTDKTNEISEEIFNSIITAYTNTHRYYHNIDHIGSMIELANEFSDEIHDRSAFYFAIFYHDLIYEPSRNDNEVCSAQCASYDLQKLNIDKRTTRTTTGIIISTEFHNKQRSNDSNLFLDLDLSILGSPKEQYESYMNNIRKEYSIYSDKQYRKGRIDVLQHFLKMQFIYKTTIFRSRFEHSARSNITFELHYLR